MPFYCLYLFIIELMSLLSSNWKIFPTGILGFVSSYSVPLSAWETHTLIIQGTSKMCLFISAVGTDLRYAKNSLKKKSTLFLFETVLLKLSQAFQRSLFTAPDWFCSFKCYINQWNKSVSIVIFYSTLFLWKI